MQNPINRIGYKAFGLTIASDFALPELTHINLGSDLTDVVVIKVDLVKEWSELAKDDGDFIVKPEFIMFRIPDVAIYLIKGGNEIFVSPLTNSEADQVRLYLLGTCMGAILFQRKILPLHGSAVVIDDEAYAIVGDSGAGKSTLASAFLKRGYKLLSDDVIPVTLSTNGIPIVTPAYPQQKLWQKSLDEFGMKSDNLRPIIDRETKFAVPVLDQFMNKKIPLAGVLELTETENDEIEIQSIVNLERFHKLFLHTYRNFFVEPAGLLNWHFNTSAKIVSQIQMFQLQRPSSRFTANELVDVILMSIKKKEEVR